MSQQATRACHTNYIESARKTACNCAQHRLPSQQIKSKPNRFTLYMVRPHVSLDFVSVFNSKLKSNTGNVKKREPKHLQNTKTNPNHNDQKNWQILIPSFMMGSFCGSGIELQASCPSRPHVCRNQFRMGVHLFVLCAPCGHLAPATGEHGKKCLGESLSFRLGQTEA